MEARTDERLSLAMLKEASSTAGTLLARSAAFAEQVGSSCRLAAPVALSPNAARITRVGSAPAKAELARSRRRARDAACTSPPGRSRARSGAVSSCARHGRCAPSTRCKAASFLTLSLTVRRQPTAKAESKATAFGRRTRSEPSVSVRGGIPSCILLSGVCTDIRAAHRVRMPWSRWTGCVHARAAPVGACVARAGAGDGKRSEPLVLCLSIFAVQLGVDGHWRECARIAGCIAAGVGIGTGIDVGAHTGAGRPPQSRHNTRAP